jgi:hypothetical protein
MARVTPTPAAELAVAIAMVPMFAVLLVLSSLCLASILLAWVDLLTPSKRSRLDDMGKIGATLAAGFIFPFIGLALYLASLAVG